MQPNDQKLPSSAVILSAREMNDLRFSTSHTILTPDYLSGAVPEENPADDKTTDEKPIDTSSVSSSID